MAVLVTGLGGHTSESLASMLQAASVPFVLASRRGRASAPAGMPAVTFDWLDETTWAAPFAHAAAGGAAITAMYVVGPPSEAGVPAMIRFIGQAAAQHGVRRVVLTAGASATVGGPGYGQVWKFLVDEGLEWCVLRPSWFTDNLAGDRFGFRETITKEDKIYTATGSGRISFLTGHDIAAVAFRALTDATPHNTDYLLVGPELLSYDDLAAKISKHCGRTITHVHMTQAERAANMAAAGLPAPQANYLAMVEVGHDGKDDAVNDNIEQVTGKKAQTFDEFAEQYKAAWAPAK